MWSRRFAGCASCSVLIVSYSTDGAPMKKLLLLALSSAVLVASVERGLASPVGLWLAKDGAKVRISPCGRGMCGFIAQALKDPATGRPMTDKHNPDPAKRNRPLTGVQTLISMNPVGANR